MLFEGYLVPFIVALLLETVTFPSVAAMHFRVAVIYQFNYFPMTEVFMVCLISITHTRGVRQTACAYTQAHTVPGVCPEVMWRQAGEVL